jgi:hypothetical protein
MTQEAPNLDTSSGRPGRKPSLPIAKGIRLVYVFSAIIALVMALTSLAGILLQDVVYPADELISSFLATDGFTLVVALPILLASMGLAARGKLIGLLCWPGALLYVLYIHVIHLIGVPFGLLFLPYLTLVTMSAYTVIALVASIDAGQVGQRLAGYVPARTAGIILTILSALFLFQLVPTSLAALVRQDRVPATELALWVADFTVAPTWLIGGILLWRRRALGYVAGAGLLLVYALLFSGTVPVMLYAASLAGEPPDMAGVVTMSTLGLICLVTFAVYARGVFSRSGSGGTGSDRVTEMVV